MNLTGADFRKLILPAIVALGLCAVGAALVWFVNRQLINENARLTTVKNERFQATERLNRISEEEREVKERIEVYRRLRELHIIGKEKRLDWADAIQRIRTSREMLDVKYRIEPQKVITSIAAKPGKVEFHASLMRVELALLHEGDLLAFIEDLRNAGNAYVSVRRCVLMRSGLAGASTGTSTLTPRLRAECQIDLITITDAGAKA
jgi:hypothetical protein